MTRGLLSLLLLTLVASCALFARSASAVERFTSPDWFIDFSDHGYSDFLIYTAGPFPPGELHEELSGEWGAAIGYDGIDVDQGITESTQWLEPEFVYPDWTTNSAYSVVSAIGPIGGPPGGPPADDDSDGLPEGESTISNGSLEVRIVYDMEDSGTGHPMGLDPNGAGGSSVLANRYVLRQTYHVKNVSGVELQGLRFYQLIHGHPANTETPTAFAVRDPSLYSGALSGFRYDVTHFATNTGEPAGAATGFTCTDVVGFSSELAPAAWGHGAFRGHAVGKPADPDVEPDGDGDGIHFEVERDSLELETDFGPDEVGSAQRYDVASLGAGATEVFEVLLSVRSDCSQLQPVPGLPVVAWIALCASLGIALVRVSSRTPRSGARSPGRGG
jgi:hypothetical protein